MLQLKAASRQAGVSTASMGKFDRMAKGEKAADRLPSGKKRKFLAVSDKASLGRWRGGAVGGWGVGGRGDGGF